MVLPEFLGSSWLAQHAQELLLSMEQRLSSWARNTERLSITLLGVCCLSCGLGGQTFSCLLLCARWQLWLPDSVLSRVRDKAQTQEARCCINRAHSAYPAFLRLAEVLCLCDELLARLCVLLRKKSAWVSSELTVWGLQNCHLPHFWYICISILSWYKS